MLRVTIDINGRVICQRTAINQGRTSGDFTVYHVKEDKAVVYHKREDGAVVLAQILLDTIEEPPPYNKDVLIDMLVREARAEQSA